MSKSNISNGSVRKHSAAKESWSDHCPIPCCQCSLHTQNKCRIWWWRRKMKWELRASAFRCPNGYYQYRQQCDNRQNCDPVACAKARASEGELESKMEKIDDPADGGGRRMSARLHTTPNNVSGIRSHYCGDCHVRLSPKNRTGYCRSCSLKRIRRMQAPNNYAC
jgi:hypothetical protein